MQNSFSRRHLLQAAGASAAVGALPRAAKASGYDYFTGPWNDLINNFWVGDQNGYIKPQSEGFTSLYYAQRSQVVQGIQSEVQGWNGVQPTMWTQAQFVHLTYWHWRLVGGSDLANRIGGNFSWLYNSAFGPAALQDASINSQVVHASDDVAWVANSYLDVYDALGSQNGMAQNALICAKGLLNSAYHNYNPTPGSNPVNGLYYAIPGTSGAQGYPPVSSLYEVGIALACLRIYNITVAQGAPVQGWLNRAQISHNWIWSKLLDTSNNLLYVDVNLSTLQPQLNYPGQHVSVRGATDYFFGGQVGMAVLCANLYNTTGNQTYKSHALTLTKSIPNYFVEYDSTQNHNVFMNDRDPFTETFFLPEWVAVVRPLIGSTPNMDPLIVQTASSILGNCRTPDGFWTADWVAGRYWAYRANSGSGQAVPEQLQTSSSTVGVLLANAWLG